MQLLVIQNKMFIYKQTTLLLHVNLEINLKSENI